MGNQGSRALVSPSPFVLFERALVGYSGASQLLLDYSSQLSTYTPLALSFSRLSNKHAAVTLSLSTRSRPRHAQRSSPPSHLHHHNPPPTHPSPFSVAQQPSPSLSRARASPLPRLSPMSTPAPPPAAAEDAFPLHALDESGVAALFASLGFPFYEDQLKGEPLRYGLRG